MKGELVLPKIRKCHVGDFSFDELKELRLEFEHYYIMLLKRLKDFIEHGEFQQYPCLDPDDCNWCFVRFGCKRLHLEDIEDEEITVVGETFGDEPL